MQRNLCVRCVDETQEPFLIKLLGLSKYILTHCIAVIVMKVVTTATEVLLTNNNMNMTVYENWRAFVRNCFPVVGRIS